MTTAKRILVIDDDKAMCTLVADMLAPKGFAVQVGENAQDIVAQIDAARADVLLTDLRMPRGGGLSLCRDLASARPDIPVVVMTGFGSLENAIESIRAGAYDFVTKPVDAASLSLVLDRAVAHHRLKSELRILKEQHASGDGGGDTLVGKSVAMRAVRDVVRQVADLDVTVLVTGETGTGKEAVARALHAASARRDRPFVTVHCGALPAEIEAQLFGQSLSQAAGGTLFLEEIDALPVALQARLVEALEDRPVDVRVVVATVADLEAAVADGTFREDLFYRLNVVHLELPPLRARGDDVLALAQLFLERAARRLKRPVRGIAPPAAAALLAHPWPGNVRELAGAVERAVALTKYEDIVASDLPERAPPKPVAGEVEMVSLDEMERRHVLGVLEKVGWNRRRAAGILGVDPKTLYRKLLQWGVSEPTRP
jgi:two-component system response regulator HydG